MSSPLPSPPVVWRAPFPHRIQQELVSYTNPSGTVTNSDLELAALITGAAVGATTPASLRHALHCAIDNTPALAWSTRGSTSSNTAPAYLLRLHAYLARQGDYTLRPLFTPGSTNTLADFCSRSFHLDDAEFLHAVNDRFPTQPCWTLAHPTNDLLSNVISALSRKMLPWESADLGPMPHSPPGKSGLSSATPSSKMLISKKLKTPSSFCAFSPNDIEQASWLPAVLQSELGRWKMPFAPLARRWPHWDVTTRDCSLRAN
jgi:hypothetical protein